MADEIHSGKRRRTSQPSPPDPTGIAHLPDSVLSNVAEYLHLPSRALFAVSLTAPSSEAPRAHAEGRLSSASRAVLRLRPLNDESHKEGGGASGAWDVLDFSDIEEGLRMKMNDDDLHAVLVFIDAKTNLKRLNLSRLNHPRLLVNISGRGLGELNGSAVLEKIDLEGISSQNVHDVSERLRLARVERGGTLPVEEINRIIGEEDRRSMEDVLQLLDSIIDLEGESSMKHILFPSHWTYYDNRDRQSRQSGEPPWHSRQTWGEKPMYRFLAKYDDFLINKNARCSKCDRRILRESWLFEDSNFMSEQMRRRRVPFQKHTCHICLNFICSGRTSPDNCQLYECDGYCQRRCCKDCYCNGCGVCNRCTSGSYRACQGEDCGGKLCQECLKECSNCNSVGCDACLSIYKCEGCGKENCERCRNGVANDLDGCENEYCENMICSACIFDRHTDREIDCSVCLRRIVDGIGPKMAEMDRIGEENETMRGQLENQCLEMEELRREIEELRQG